MAANRERKPGSNLGRAVIDWEQAFAFYASLPPERRCYQAVADQFAVSVRTVEKQGRNRHWQRRLREIHKQTAAKTDEALSQARADHLADLVKLIQASLIGYAEQLRRGDVRMSPADLDRLHKLWQQLSGELSEPTSPQPVVPVPVPATRSAEHTVTVIAALRDSGALTALGLQSATRDTNHSSEE